MSERYIDIVEKGGNERASTLVNELGGGLRVMGVLPHGYIFEAASAKDAQASELREAGK